MNREIKKEMVISGGKLTLGYIGLLTGIIGIVLLIPLFVSISLPLERKYWWNFFAPAIIMIICGFSTFLGLLYKKEHGQLSNRQSSFIVLTSWIISILGTAVPFWSSGLLNFHQSIFEVSSGWTTTGMSVLDVEQGNIYSFLTLRALCMLFGGIGIILVMISVFSDRYGLRLYSAEGHGDSFLPNLLRSARLMFAIYIGLITVGFISYMIFGMSFFDAFVHSITAVATGGFSNYNDSIAHFSIENGYNIIQVCGIQVTSIILMFSGSISFISFAFLLRGDFKTFFKNFENHAELVILVIVIPLILILSITSNTVTSNNALMYSVFFTISAMSTTGFQIMSIDINTLNPAICFIFILIMLIGCQSSSTCGGIKVGRISLLYHSLVIKLRNSANNLNIKRADYVNVYGKDMFLDEALLHDNNIFILTYLGIYLAGAFLFTLGGSSLNQSLFESASMISTIGLSTGMVNLSSPTYYYYVGASLMIFGRFELFMVIYGIIYIFSIPFNKIKLLLSRRK